MISRALRYAMTMQRQAEYLTKVNALKSQSAEQEQLLKKLNSERKQASNILEVETKKVSEIRGKIMEEQAKEDRIWAKANMEIAQNKREAIKKFAEGLVKLNDCFEQIKTKETENHPEDIKEGFNNTVRLFNSTLLKFNIAEATLKVGDKPKMDSHILVVEKEKTDKPELKGTVSKIISKGWVLKELKKNSDGREELIVACLLRPSKVVLLE